MITYVDILVDGIFYHQFPYRHAGALNMAAVRTAAAEAFPSLAYKARDRWECFPNARKIQANARIDKSKS